MSTTKRTIQIAPHVSCVGNKLSCVQGHVTIPRSAILALNQMELNTSPSSCDKELALDPMRQLSSRLERTTS